MPLHVADKIVNDPFLSFMFENMADIDPSNIKFMVTVFGLQVNTVKVDHCYFLLFRRDDQVEYLTGSKNVSQAILNLFQVFLKHELR
jgi:hypothetical protein